MAQGHTCSVELMATRGLPGLGEAFDQRIPIVAWVSAARQGKALRATLSCYLGQGRGMGVVVMVLETQKMWLLSR